MTGAFGVEADPTSEDGQVTLRLSGPVGEADVAGAVRFARERLRPAGVRALVVDVAAITFIDSSGLGLLVQLRRLAEDRGATFVLRGVQSRLARLLELTGLLGYLAAE